jgi:hypothetical protein
MGFKEFWEEHVVLKPHLGSFGADEPGAIKYTNVDMDPIRRKDRTYQWVRMPERKLAPKPDLSISKHGSICMLPSDRALKEQTILSIYL